MGYFVAITDSDAFIPAEKLETAYQKMCALNTTHDDQKRGGRWNGGECIQKWFSWMDANYPETCKDAKDIFEQMGVSTEYDAGGNLKITGYDNKTGQEQLFLDAIKDDLVGSISWQGENGEKWKQLFGLI